MENGNGVIRLLDTETGCESARLEDPHQDSAKYLIFASDGSRLAATNNDSKSIHVWNLRAIRGQLAEMGLDWDLPKNRPADPVREPISLGKAPPAISE